MHVRWQGGRIRESRLSGALHTEMKSRVDIEPASGDFIAAIRAITEFALIQPLQGLLKLEASQLTPPLCLARHGLSLHGVHARQPA